MLFSVPRCATWDWERAFSRNNPAQTTQHSSLSLPLGGRNVSLLQYHEQERGSRAVLTVGGAGVTRRESQSEFVALQRGPALCVAPVSGLGYHHLPSTWHTFCKSERQAQLLITAN